MDSEYRFSKRNTPPVNITVQSSKNSFSLLSGFDGDSVLILMLIFLLQKEKADKWLILALMYILT